MKIAITGSGGLLGKAVSRMCRDYGHQCHALDFNVFLKKPIFLLRDELSRFDIDLLFHCAANTNVDGCEKSPETAYRDNWLLSERIAAASPVKIVYISSTGVYGDYQSAPYTDYDDTRPSTHYHRSKLQGEHAVLSQNASALIVRTGWLFGGTADQHRNFVAARIRETRTTGGVLKSNPYQFGCPTYVDDLVSRLFDLIENGEQGVFNLVNSGSGSRFDYVQEIVKAAKIDCVVQKASREAFERAAPISANEMAYCLKMQQLSYPDMPDWRDALNRYLASGMIDINAQ